MKTTQPVVLTDERIDDMWVQAGKRENGLGYMSTYLQARVFARAVLATQHPTAPLPYGAEAWSVVPDYRGYAHLGTGQYLLNNSAAGDAPELIISIATPEGRAGRTVNDDGPPNPPGTVIEPESMAVRIRFADVVGLDALEKQLRRLRKEHFGADWDAMLAASPPHPGSTQSNLTSTDDSTG